MEYKGIKTAELQSKALRDVQKFTVAFLSQKARKLYKLADNQFKTKFGYKLFGIRWFKKRHQKKQLIFRLPQIDFVEVKRIYIKSDVSLEVKFRIRYKNEDEFQYISINFNATRKAYKTDINAMYKFNPMSIRKNV